MRLTIRTNLAMRALMACAVNAPDIVRKNDIATCCNASVAHLGVVINKLAQEGFVTTLRGRGGGIRLARPADQISVGAVFRSFESTTPFTECFPGGENHCPIASACRLRGVLCNAIAAFYAELDKVTLADLIEGNTDLGTLLELREPA